VMLAQTCLRYMKSRLLPVISIAFPQMHEQQLKRDMLLLMRRTTLGLMICICALFVNSCQKPSMIWRSEVKSPDGIWEAAAESFQSGGFGSAACWTTVTLRRLDGAVNQGKPYDVLSLNCDGMTTRAYELDSRNASVQHDFALSWTGAKHLLVAYNEDSEVTLQVVKLSDVAIEFRSVQ